MILPKTLDRARGDGLPTLAELAAAVEVADGRPPNGPVLTALVQALTERTAEAVAGWQSVED